MRKRYNISDFLEVKVAGDASFSPDETRVVYLSNSTGTHQVFLISIDGGVPEQLTDFNDPVSFVRFSPTDDAIIFGKAEGGNERTQLYLLDLHTRQIVDLTAKPEARHDFGAWSPDGKSICYASNERNGEDFDVYVMDIKTLEKSSVFDEGGWCAAEGFSPQGTYIVVRRKHSNANTDLYLCNLLTGEVEPITPHSGDILHIGAFWLPDESAFFLIQDRDKEFKGLASYTLIDRKIAYVFTPHWDIEGIALDKSGENICVTINEDGYEQVTIYSPKTFVARSYQLPDGNIYRTRFSSSGRRMAFSLGDSRHTSDIWILSMETGQVRQLTHSLQGVPPEVMIEPELIHYESFDGLSVPAFIYKTKESEDEARAPVLINIHGGPEAQYQPTYDPVMQYLVHSGYTVIAPNIRGSSGYGKSYMALDDKGKRMDSIKDVVELRNYIADLPDMSTTRFCLYGASYGGYMVLACLAFYPEYWAAAVDIVGIVNFVTFLENTASYRRAHREAEYGSLENDRDLLVRISPIHSVENIQASLFVIHGANDPRVPLSEAEQIVTRLKELGRNVELLVYPDEGHGIAKLQNKLDVYPKVIEFLNRELKEKDINFSSDLST